MNPFHIHRFEITSVKQGVAHDGSAVTAILRICQCGEFKSETILGHWNAGDFDRKHTDLEIAKQLGVRL